MDRARARWAFDLVHEQWQRATKNAFFTTKALVSVEHRRSLRVSAPSSAVLGFWVSLVSALAGRRGSSSRTKDAVAQVVQDQEEAGEEDEAEQAHPSLDSQEDRQHHQVQREAQALAPHQAWILRCFNRRYFCFG